MSLVLVFVLVVSLVYFVQSKYRIFLTGWRLPGPWAVPMIGNIQMISNFRPKYLFLKITSMRDKYQQSYRLWLGTQLWVFLHSPTETRDALNEPTLIKADTFNQLSVLLGHGLLISRGDHWAAHRRILGPAFHPDVLESYAPVISDSADELLAKLAQHVDEEIEVSSYIFPCVLDAIIATSMGANLQLQHDRNAIYSEAFHHASQLLFERMSNPMLASDFIFQRTRMYHQLKQSLNVIHTLTNKVIAIGKKRLHDYRTEEGQGSQRRPRRGLLDTLLTAQIDGRPLTRQAVRDEINTFVFAGVDTTSASMGFVLYALAKHPDKQLKIVEELRSHGVTNEAGKIEALPYMDIFLKECLRFYTVVPMTARQTTADCKIGERYYCAGVTLWINMYGLAHDPNYFDDPHVFRPERFEKTQQMHMPPFTNIPFSGGPHVCIGRKYAIFLIKVLVVKILRSFELSLPENAKELVFKAQMVLTSLHGIRIVFQPRK